jgi:hypothetical protein
MTGFSGHTTKKSRGRPHGSLGPTATAIRASIDALVEEYDEMTVRQVFYALTVRGIVQKTEAGYRQVQRQVLEMRGGGLLDWEFIADATRWVRNIRMYDRLEDALHQAANSYRRDLWRTQSIRMEFWLEKDALASIVSQVTALWRVDLMVSRGQSSETYCYEAAQAARRAWRLGGHETFVYTLYDADKSGRSAAAQVAKKLTKYSGEAPITVIPLALTDGQIAEWELPSRPAKEKGEPDAVELDAIPPDKLKKLVENTIIEHIDADAWRMAQQVEQSEREIFARLIGDAE